MINQMRMREKVAVAMLACLLVFLLMFVFAYKAIEKKMVTDLELQEEFKQISFLHNQMQKETETLNITNLDWARWDLAYKFLETRDKAFIIDNINGENLKTMRLNILVYLDLNGEVVAGQVYNGETSCVVSEATFAQKQALRVKEFLNTPSFKELLKEKKDFTGLVLIGGEDLSCIAVNQVVKNDGTGLPRGFLLMGRYLNDAFSKSFLKDGVNKVALLKYNEQEFRNKTANALKSNLNNQEWAFLNFEKKSDQEVSALLLFNDIFGRPVLMMDIELMRNNYVDFLKTLRWFGYLLLSLLLCAMVAIYFILHKMIFKRVELMESVALEMTSDLLSVGYTEKNMSDSGSDELTNISVAINELSGKLREKIEK